MTTPSLPPAFRPRRATAWLATLMLAALAACGGGGGSDDDDDRMLDAEARASIDRIVAAQMKAYVRRSSPEPEEWRTAGSWSTGTYLTAAELAELGEELNAVTDRFVDRITNPQLRPEGSRPVRIHLATWLPRPITEEER